MDNQSTFENSMLDLDRIIKQMESGQLTLDQSLESFEKGIGLIRDCEKKLGDAKGRIEKLVQSVGGSVELSAFDSKL